jgi:hypothetical protein
MSYSDSDSEWDDTSYTEYYYDPPPPTSLELFFGLRRGEDEDSPTFILRVEAERQRAGATEGDTLRCFWG